MKSKFLIIIVLVVAAVHVTLFVMTQRKGPLEISADEKTTPPAAEPSTNQVTQPPEKPVVTKSRPESSEAKRAVNEAVNLIQKNESVTNAVKPVSPPAPVDSQPEVSPESDATMVLGLVEGNSKLTPELFDVAEEGAKAVAAQDWENARKLYLRMVNDAPDNALGYANLGVAEHQLGNLLAASGNLRRSLEINPSIAQNWQTLGIIHYERDELELAISSLTRAIHEDPSDPRSRLYLAAVVRSYGWLEASITELERAVETDPEFADAHYNLAVSYIELKPPRIELARRHYYSALDLGAEPSSEIESVFQSSDENE
ncbi:MAG: tetratricopeptide repeat protein [Verrucomicrobiota bacterium]